MPYNLHAIAATSPCRPPSRCSSDPQKPRKVRLSTALIPLLLFLICLSLFSYLLRIRTSVCFPYRLDLPTVTPPPPSTPYISVKEQTHIMTARVAPGSSSYSEPPTIISPTADHDVLRGRKRERSLTRGSVRPFRAALPDESSNLRGRSRRRAASPALNYTSRPSSPRRVPSPTRRRLLHARLRREHCPSRVASPAEQQLQLQLQQHRPARSKQRTRSQSRGPRLEMELGAQQSTDGLSGLRNEVRASSSDTADETKPSA